MARPYIQDSIVEGPPALDEATRAFPQQRPFLRNSELFFHELRPGVRALRAAAPVLADAFEIGTQTLKRTPAMNSRAQADLRGAAALRRGPARHARRARPDQHGDSS